MSEMISKEELGSTKQRGSFSGLPDEMQPDQVVEINQDDDVRNIVRAEIHQMELFSGPIPKPEIIQQYEEVLPGSAERILKMAENEAEHRHTMEEGMMKTEARDSLLGILSAFALCAGTIIAGLIVALKVPNVAGTIMGCLFGASGLIGIFSVIIKSTRTSWQIKKAESSIPDQLQVDNKE